MGTFGAWFIHGVPQKDTMQGVALGFFVKRRNSLFMLWGSMMSVSRSGQDALSGKTQEDHNHQYANQMLFHTRIVLKTLKTLQGQLSGHRLNCPCKV